MSRLAVFTITLITLTGSFAAELSVLNPKDSNMTVLKHTEDIKKCYEAALAKKPTTAGKLTLAWVTDKDGKVLKNSVADNQTGSTDLASCVTTISKKWIFLASPENQSPDVTYDFAFSVKK